MERIEIVVPGGSARPFQREVWTFVYLESRHTLKVVRWARETKATTRHKWRAERVFDAHRPRDGEPCPAVPEAIAEAARFRFMAGLTVTGPL